MSVYVVDSSVAIKWFVPEVDAATAVRLQAGPIPLHAPDFIDVELAAITWKKMRREGMTRAEADFIITNLPMLAVQKHPTDPLVSAAFDIADRTSRSVYDCLYLALADQLGGQMVTADEKLANALAGTTWAARVVKLQDVP